MKAGQAPSKYNFSFDEEFLKHSKNIYRHLIYRGAPKGVAEEVVQEAFIKLYEGREEFPNENALRGWLYRVAENTFINHQNLSATRLEKGSSDLEGIRDFDALPAEHGIRELELSIDDCVTVQLDSFRKINPNGTFAIQMQLDGCSTAEIASVLGKTEGTTRVYLHEAKKALRPFLEKCREFIS
jgi:RNA polymerase sigma-70 factor (ECF subfamily)